MCTLCLREHLGIDTRDAIQADVIDPTIASFYKNVWMKQASINTIIYDKVFRCVPSDDIRSFQQLKVSSTLLMFSLAILKHCASN